MKNTLQVVREYLGTKVHILTDIFRSSAGTPPGVPVARYRADHIKWLDALDQLETGQLFLARHTNSSYYHLRVYALPLLTDIRAQKLVSLMNDLYQEFATIYRDRLNGPVSVEEILDLADRKLGFKDSTEVKDTLYYMIESHALWSGLSNGFPYTENSTIHFSESILRQKSFEDLLLQVYEWNILNPKKRAYNKFPLQNLDKPNVKTRRRINSNKNQPSAFARRKNSAPEWYEKLPDTQKALINEIDSAIQHGLSALPTMGLRTLLEVIMREHISDKGSFKRNINAFEEAGFITKQQAALIESVIDAGNAAVHRAYFPNPSDLITCINAVRHLIEGVYILKPQVDIVLQNTPKRSS